MDVSLWRETAFRSAWWWGLNYSNPYLSPFEEFQRYKTHPAHPRLLAGWAAASPTARGPIAAGGLQALIEADLFQAARSSAMMPAFSMRRASKAATPRSKSGMLAAGSDCRGTGSRTARVTNSSRIPRAFEGSWLKRELHKTRNFKPLYEKGTVSGCGFVSASSGSCFRGKAPWTLHHVAGPFNAQESKPNVRQYRIRKPGRPTEL